MVKEFIGGWVVVFLVFDDGVEYLVIVVEVRIEYGFDKVIIMDFLMIKRLVVLVLLKLYGLYVIDFFLVLFGVLLKIISGKISWVVCVKQYGVNKL